MKPHVLIRPGGMPLAKVKKFAAVAEGLGFEVTVQEKVGRPRVEDRPGFNRELAEVRRAVVNGTLSLRQGARKLDIGTSTLHRLLKKAEGA